VPCAAILFRMFRSLGWVLLVAVAASTAAADPTSTAAAEPTLTKSATSPKRHALYVELLGKGGTWGLGYTHQVHRRFALGAVGSFSMLDGQRMLTFSPSVTAYPVGVRRHRLFVDVGPQLVYLQTPSPVPEWMGTSETGIGGQLSTGYEYRGAVFARVFAMGVVGKSGAAPWLGMDLGWAF